MIFDAFTIAGVIMVAVIAASFILCACPKCPLCR